ncbi:NAD(P)/FAD-dependent oxidoreductase [Paeniglutamicibacter sp.]|uniref:NAD(P)/FAD-dependent oxidoreductase n=1 Tax=Paeniglutamicibacter sp. TaxID=1934391 RepID=UPI0039894EA7
MKNHYGLVVVGASVAAEALTSRLLEMGYMGEILVLDADPRMPYERPPLSKNYFADPEDTEIGVEWDQSISLTVARAIGVDHAVSTVTVMEDGSSDERVISYGTLVIATGAQSIHLPFEPSDVLGLRSAGDADKIRAAADAGGKVGIIGAGAIGAELATSLRNRGAEVVLLDKSDRPLERLLAGHLGTEIARWLDDLGVESRWNVDITAITGGPGNWTVQLAGAEPVAVDVLVSAVGVRPAVGWLEASGLLRNGALVCDDEGRVLVGDQPADNIFAAGDVVTRQFPDGTLARTESWSAAVEQGSRLAEVFAGQVPAPTELPYFWTDVAGRKIQVLGTVSREGFLDVEFENPARGATLYKITDPQNSTTGWIGINAQAKIAQLRMAATVGS